MTRTAGARAADRSLLLPEGSRLLHIGPPKTGSTSLQAAFWAARREARAQGVCYAGRSRHSAQAVLAVTGRASFAEDGATPSIRHWERLLGEIRSAREPRVVLSSEGFAYARTDAIRRVVGDLDPARVQVVVTLRPLARLLASEWQEHTQSGLRVSFEHWLDAMLNRPPGRLTPTFWHRHRHDELIARWADVVGPDRVTVVVLDPADHAVLLRAFEDLLGLRPETLRAVPDLANRSLTLQEIELVRALGRRFEAEGLSRARFHRVVRMKVAGYLKTRRPEPSEPRIETPQWALDRAGEIAAEMVAAIGASGVRVVGDLESLLEVPRSGLQGDRLPEVSVPPEIAATMAMGVLVASGLARVDGGRLVAAEGGASAWIEPIEVARVPTLQLAAVLLRRLRGAALRRLRGGARPPGAPPAAAPGAS